MVNESLPTHKGSTPTLRERKRIVDESGRDAVMFDMDSSESGKIQLWDQINETWTSPLERVSAMNHYLAKVVFKCSGCSEASIYEGEIERHLVQLKANYESHVDAELERGLAEGGNIERDSGNDAKGAIFASGALYMVVANDADVTEENDNSLRASEYGIFQEWAEGERADPHGVTVYSNATATV